MKLPVRGGALKQCLRCRAEYSPGQQPRPGQLGRVWLGRGRAAAEVVGVGGEAREMALSPGRVPRRSRGTQLGDAPLTRGIHADEDL